MTVDPGRTIVLWCPDWPIVAAGAREPTLGGAPVVIVDQGERGLVVRAASATHPSIDTAKSMVSTSPSHSR